MGIKDKDKIKIIIRKKLDELGLSGTIIKLFTSGEAHRFAFEKELMSLYDDVSTRALIQSNNLQDLHSLYLSLIGKKNQMTAILKEFKLAPEEQTLAIFFKELIDTDRPLPEKAIAMEVFTSICSKTISTEYLKKLLSCKILDDLTVPQLQKLEQFFLVNLECFIDFHVEFAAECSKAEKDLVLEMLILFYPTSLSAESAQHLAYYFRNVIPLFVEKFKDQLNKTELCVHSDRLAEWFMVWRNHQYQLEEEVPKGHEYYQTEFSTIVKYITKFIWWNNGLYYRNGDKFCYFGSPGFYHLATGGSIRQAPELHPFTRRMAKIFATLAFDLNQTGMDMYIYCYTKAMGAGDLLVELLQEFIRHPSSPVEMDLELKKWNPVIQKLSTQTFEMLGRDEAHAFLGYIYHCLRDQPEFSVQGRTIASLLRESNHYYERIQERREREAQRLADNEARYQARKAVIPQDFWKPHPKVKPMVSPEYRITELTNKGSLEQEGILMKHCVGSYFQKCKRGHCSIWSLRQFRKPGWRSLVTIELDNHRQRIIQMSAAFNARPSPEHKQLIKRWAEKEKIIY